MAARPQLIVGRYAIYDRIAAGGMATVHLGRLIGEGGFSRTVAIKRLHAHLALDPEFVGMFLDEARLAARIRHPNVVQTLDVVVADSEVFLVMEYIEGESLGFLLRTLAARGEITPASHACAMIVPVLNGLHAAHEAKTDQGEPLNMVHRDVSPQNVLVGVDGVPRVLDFGVAKALGQSHATREGQIKGKLAYMSPEQIEARPVDRRTDVFAASVVLWEALAGRRLFKGEQDVHVMRMVLSGSVEPPSAFAPGVPPALDAIVLRGLSRDPAARYSTAQEMADALEEAVPPVATRKLATWVATQFGAQLVTRATLLQEIESSSGVPASAATPAQEDRAPSSDEAPTRIPSQASSIALEAPPRPSAAPASRRRLSPIALGAGVGVFCGVVGMITAVRSLRDPAVAPTNAAAAETPPSPSVTVSPSPPVAALPVVPAAESVAPEPPAPVATPAPPRPATSSRPPSVPRAAPRSPAPSSTLFTRF
jgi:serine/threonine protein kinase